MFDESQPMLTHHDQLDRQFGGARHNPLAGTPSIGTKKKLRAGGALVLWVEQPSQILMRGVSGHSGR